MKTTMISTLLLLLVASLYLPTPSLAYEKAEDEAIVAAEKFLQLMDAGQYDQGWEATASFNKSRMVKAFFVPYIGTTRTAFGSLINRAIKSVKTFEAHSGFPDGEYVSIHFESSFTHKKKANELILVMRNPDGTWAVGEYNIM